MINAYYAKTKLTFDDFIKKAYKEAKNNQERSYVKKYMRNSEKWGLYRRTHSPLLLQIKTTNAIESYHAQIKMRCEKTDSFLASMKKLDKVFKGKLNQQFKAKTDEKYKQLTEAQAYPELELFPMAFQVLIRNQFNIAVSNLESGEISKYQVSGAESPVCPCPFYQQYFLPCSHMFLKDILDKQGFFTESLWETYTQNLEENGYNVYFEMEKYIPPEEIEKEKAGNELHLKLDECHGKLDDIFWRCKEDPLKAKRMEEFIIQIGSQLTTAFDDIYIPNKSNAQVIEIMKERIPSTKIGVTPKKPKRKAAERPKRR